MTQPNVNKKAASPVAPTFQHAVAIQKACLQNEWNKGGHFSQSNARKREGREIDDAFHWTAWLYFA